jgi:hypothetical protein
MLVKSFVEEYDRSNGTILIPPQWKNEPKKFHYKSEQSCVADIAKAAESRAPY